jgi:hypothetical protein
MTRRALSISVITIDTGDAATEVGDGDGEGEGDGDDDGEGEGEGEGAAWGAEAPE